MQETCRCICRASKAHSVLELVFQCLVKLSGRNFDGSSRSYAHLLICGFLIEEYLFQFQFSFSFSQVSVSVSTLLIDSPTDSHVQPESEASILYEESF